MSLSTHKLNGWPAADKPDPISTRIALEEDDMEYLDDDDDEDYQDEEPYNEHNGHVDYGSPTAQTYDKDDEYANNYDAVYDDGDYADDPPKRKKYRASDRKIKPLSYEDAKLAKDRQIKDKFQKRYSKYTPTSTRDRPISIQTPILPEGDEEEDDDESTNEDDTTTNGYPKTAKVRCKDDEKQPTHATNGKHKKGKKTGKKAKKQKKTKKKGAKKDKLVRPGSIDLSLTNDASGKADEARLDTPLHRKEPMTPAELKEISLFYNKKTQDQYNEFEMNTYDSSDEGSTSDQVKKKYLISPITPAPEEVGSSHGKQGKKKKGGKGKEAALADRAKKNEQMKKKKKKFTLKEFMGVDLTEFVKKYDGDNFDVAKAVCKWYDDATGDTDTVTIVSDTSLGPNTAYWSKGDYNRVEKDCGGKYIMVYRACKHVPGTVKVKQDIFESCVKGLCMDNLGHSQLIADKLDSVFGEGCHVSLASHDKFEVFCRYSDSYICEVELPSGDFVVAWRR